MFKFNNQQNNRSRGRSNESLFAVSSTNRAFFENFGFWFLFCLILGLGSMGVIVYVTVHFLAKVW